MTELTYTQTKSLLDELGRPKVKELIENDIDMLKAACNLGIPPRHIEGSYEGYWVTDKEFAQDYLHKYDSRFLYDMPKYVHINWDATIKDLMQHYGEENGYYFRGM